MVFYVGGVTHMEIAALRHLSRSPKFPYRILIVTTKVLNGKYMLASIEGQDQDDSR